ncbi:protein RESPONSE TO ABA AND SALT 1-like [Syzygium oleosum]|uniref:protein RESPONSE TO ABA AND SALT 1-like n=1 Tax=Syzygium oleosum TaxID=219896 RepID=UPI0024B91DC3|nr:protein RESPONSE TO ABA AND SALT 1-like [Syzygium oleosum]
MPLPSSPFLKLGWSVKNATWTSSSRPNTAPARQDDHHELIHRVLYHYQQYSEEKSRVARWDVFLVFSPPWFTGLERAFLWIAGFKPNLLFRLVSSSVSDMTEDQSQRINRLVAETRMQEKVLNDEMAKIQERVGAPPLANAIRRYGKAAQDGEMTGGTGDSAIGGLRKPLEKVVANADMLRATTAEKVALILTPAQIIKVLVAVAQLQLKVRSLGLQRDAERGL